MRFTGCLLVLAGLSLAGNSASAGWPFFAEGPRRGSVEWYELHACDPIGQRQKFKFGKVWPVSPRPIGDKAPLIHQYHHNQYWPYPYVDADEASALQFSQIQIMNGWEEATTLYDYHFDQETQQLNSAGREHLYYIVSRVPAEFRTAYVQASLRDPAITSTRVQAVETELAAVLGNSQSLAILPRVTTPVGTPAADVNAVFTFRRETPSPSPTLSVVPGAAGGGTE
jgi:hypothetical protein